MTDEFITGHGFKFRVEGHNFGNNVTDFEAVCSHLASTVACMSSNSVASLHRAATWDVDTESYVDPDETHILNIALSCCHEMLASLGWERPCEAFVSIFAV